MNSAPRRCSNYLPPRLLEPWTRPWAQHQGKECPIGHCMVNAVLLTPSDERITKEPVMRLTSFFTFGILNWLRAMTLRGMWSMICMRDSESHCFHYYYLWCGFSTDFLILVRRKNDRQMRLYNIIVLLWLRPFNDFVIFATCLKF